MEKKCNVYLLDTEGKSVLFFQGNTLQKDEKYFWGTPHCQPKHLYFTSDEKIKEGDWYLFNIDGWELMQCQDEEEATRCNSHFSIKNQCKKIVATTNPELHTKPDMLRRADGCPFWLQPNGLYQASDEHGLETLDTSKLTLCVPRIGDDFVEVYIEGYKEGKPITEVNVEYTFDAVKKWIGHTSRENYRPKLRSDGAVIANPVVAEKLLTRAEALAMLEDYDRELKLDTFAYKEAPTFTVESWFNNKYKI